MGESPPILSEDSVKSHPFFDRAGQCWLWNFGQSSRTRVISFSRRIPFRPREPDPEDLWQLVVVVISSEWDIAQRGDLISHRCVEFDERGQARIIRLKESARLPWHAKPEFFRRVDSHVIPPSG